MLKIKVTNLTPEGELMLMAFMKRLEYLGNVGSSREVTVFSDAKKKREERQEKRKEVQNNAGE